ncbi:MAG: cytochrome c biogenesis protein CcdA [FCB group bacterium]|jgi:thiol:disulfide interchange protein DsbD
MMKYRHFLMIMLIAFFAIFSVGLTQTKEHVKLSASPSKLKVGAGEKFTIRLDMKFDEDYYTYSLKEQVNKEGLGPNKTTIKVNPSKLVAIDGKIKSSKPSVKQDPAYEIQILYYKHTAEFDIPVTAKQALDFNKDKITIIADMQLCNKTSCLPPEDYKTIVSGNVFAETTNEESKQEEQAAAPAVSQNTPVTEKVSQASLNNKQNETNKTDTPRDKGFWAMLLVAMAAGAAALVTPCVFPMVPITVSFFTKRVEQTKGKGLRDAIVYALGIIISFTGLGFVFSILFGASGVQNLTSNPWVAFFIAAIFLIFGLSLFGAYEIQLPTGLMNKLNAKSQSGSGVSSVILMGITFSLASFSCTGPLVGAALVAAAKGDWFYPIVSMAGFSTVLAFPFFFLALFPTAMTKMPRAGGWMNNIKGVLGFIVLMAALKFIDAGLTGFKMGLSRELFLAFWVGCSLLITLYVLGIFKMQHDAPVDRVGTTRLLFGVFFATITFYLISGFSGKSMGFLEAYLPAPAEASISASIVPGRQVVTNEVWLDNYKQAVDLAKKENKSLFIDFTGRHCSNCRLMERNVLNKPEIKNLFGKMILVRLITDVQEEPYLSNKQLQLSRYNSVELPLYVLLTPDEKLIDRVPYTPNVDEFRNFLQKGVR